MLSQWCRLLFALCVAAPLCRGQVSLFTQSHDGVVLGQNAPGGISLPFEVPFEGELAGAWWGFTTTGARSLTLRYILPSGAAFEQVVGSPWASWEPLYGQETRGTWQLQAVEQGAGPAYTLNSGVNLVVRRRDRRDLPVTGPPAPGMEELDDIMLGWLREKGFEAATLAVTRDRRLVCLRGYGWQDRARTMPLNPRTVMRLASCTKPVTEATVRALASDGLLALTDTVYDLLAIPPPAGMALGDARHTDITVEQLLLHTSGLAGNAPSTGQIGQALGLGRAATLEESIAWMWTQPLAFTPGTANYSNWGYQLLGGVIEKVSGMSYAACVKARLMEPAGAHGFALATHDGGAPGEVWYAGEWFAWRETDPAGVMGLVEAPLALDMETRPAAGSLLCSAADYCRHMNHYFLNGRPKPANLAGYSWLYEFHGSLPGTLAAAHERVFPDGTHHTFTLLVNERKEGDDSALSQVTAALASCLLALPSWPEHDYFQSPPLIYQHPADQTAALGQRARLRVLATGDGLTYQWYQGQSGDTTRPLPGATSPVYHTHAQAGVAHYWVRVTPPAPGPGEDSRTASVTFVESPAAIPATLDADSLAGFSPPPEELPWFSQDIEAHGGPSAMQSSTPPARGRSILAATVEGSGTLSYWAKTASTSPADALYLLVDGVLQPGRLAGNAGWARREAHISSAGPHRLEWVYERGATAQGAATAWLDEVAWAPAQPAFPAWAAAQGWSGAQALDAATPLADGVPNLLRYALRLSPGAAPRVTDGFIPGLPRLTVHNGQLTYAYVKDGTLSDVLLQPRQRHSTGHWLPLTGAVNETPLADGLIRVETTAPLDTSRALIRLEALRP